MGVGVAEGFGKEKKKQECDMRANKGKASRAPGTEIRRDCEGRGDQQTGHSEALGPWGGPASASSLHPWTRTRFSRGLGTSVFSGGRGWRCHALLDSRPPRRLSGTGSPDATGGLSDVWEALQSAFVLNLSHHADPSPGAGTTAQPPPSHRTRPPEAQAGSPVS